MGRTFEIPSSADENEVSRRIMELERHITDAKSLVGTTRLRLKEFLGDI